MFNNTMELTNLTIHPSKFENSKTRALCTATFNNALTISGIRIMQGNKGIFVAFPRSGGTGKQRPIVYPATKEIHKSISSRILSTYVINYCVNEYEV